MAKKANQTPSRTCADCFHFSACNLWAVSIATDVAPKCQQFEPERYASLSDLNEMHQMAKGELVPVVHGRWVHDINNLYGCSACLERETMSYRKMKKYCPNCGAKMDAKEEDHDKDQVP